MHLRPMHDRLDVSRALERRTFSFPHEVVDDPSLNLSEKRAILAEWASDRSAVRSFPTLRRLPGTTFPVTFSSIMDARQQLDRIAAVSADCEEEALGRVVVANFRRSRRGGEGAPQ